MTSADCVNTQSEYGRNATPLVFIEAAKQVMGYIDLDPCSDVTINQGVGAERIYTLQDDGFAKDWEADTVWLNPPGTSISNGKVIKGVQWIRKLHESIKSGKVNQAIALTYRGGSFGGLGYEIISEYIHCFTCAGVTSTAVNGSGRISFELIEDEERYSQSSNTQSSVFTYFYRSTLDLYPFYDVFKQFGVILS